MSQYAVFGQIASGEETIVHKKKIINEKTVAVIMQYHIKNECSVNQNLKAKMPKQSSVYLCVYVSSMYIYMKKHRKHKTDCRKYVVPWLYILQQWKYHPATQSTLKRDVSFIREQCLSIQCTHTYTHMQTHFLILHSQVNCSIAS